MPKTALRLAVLCLAVSLPLCAGEGDPPPWLLRGPVLGSPSPHGITVWLQAAVPARVRIAASPADGGDPAVSDWLDLAVEERLMGTLRLEGLRPGTTYRYWVEAEGLPPAAGEGFTFTTPPPDGSPVRLTFAAGSGASDRRVTRPRVWAAIAQAHPELVVALGDTPYADTLLWSEGRAWKWARRELEEHPSDAARRRLDGATARFVSKAPEALAMAYEVLREARGFSTMARGTFWVATWDDHETGINNGDLTNPVNAIALEAFRRFTPNPSFGLPGAPGTFWMQPWGDVEIYLLDDQSFRTPTREARTDPEHATILGKAQFDWLVQRLAASKATFKILVSGSPFNDFPRKTDAWVEYPVERARLMDAIARHRVGGVVLLSGDIHRSELHRLPWLEERGGYPLWEFIPSPLYQKGRRCGEAVAHREFCLGATSGEILQYFGLVRVDTTLEDPELVLELRDVENNVLLHRVLRASELRFPGS